MGDYGSDKKENVNQNSVNVNINIDELADKLAQKISLPSFKNTSGKIVEYNEDDFDMSSTFEKLAESMVVNRENDANFKQIGDVKVNKKDDDDSATIDILSGLDD